jgi:hypothetical protein
MSVVRVKRPRKERNNALMRMVCIDRGKESENTISGRLTDYKDTSKRIFGGIAGYLLSKGATCVCVV